MPFSPIEILASGSSTGATTQQTASFTPPQNALICVAFRYHRFPTTAPTVTGNNLTYAQAHANAFRVFASSNVVTLFIGMGNNPAAGPITFTFGGATTNLDWVVFAIKGTDTSGSGGSGAIVQAESAAQSNGMSITLAAFGAATNGTLGVLAINANNAVDPGEGFDEVYDAGQTDARLFVEWQTQADTGVDASFTGSAGCIGVEIKVGPSPARAVGGGVSPGGPAYLGA